MAPEKAAEWTVLGKLPDGRLVRLKGREPDARAAWNALRVAVARLGEGKLRALALRGIVRPAKPERTPEET